MTNKAHVAIGAIRYAFEDIKNIEDAEPVQLIANLQSALAQIVVAHEAIEDVLEAAFEAYGRSSLRDGLPKV